MNKKNTKLPGLLACLILFAVAGECRAEDQTSATAAVEVAVDPGQPEAGGEAQPKGKLAIFLERIGVPADFDAEKLNEQLEKTSLIPIFKKGGPIMWPLLVASILALGTVIDRFFFLFHVLRKRDSKAMANFFAAIADGDTDEAIRIGNESKFYVVRTLGFALAHKDKSLANALIFAQEQEMKRFRRGIPILDSIITLAPLLGLLGTVTGMMGSFSLIGGELSTPGAITGGIAEALIATAFGLGIAITSLIPFNLLNNKMEEASLEIRSAATQLELLMHPHMVAITATEADFAGEFEEEEEDAPFSDGEEDFREAIMVSRGGETWKA